MSTGNNPQGKMVFTRPKSVIRIHWFNAVSWLLLTVSGLGIVRGDLRFMPAGFTEWMQSVVGGQFNLIVGHSLYGIIWATILAAFAIANWNNVMLPFLKRVLTLTPASILTDMKSMGITIAQLFGLLKKAELPPVGRYNGAQRLLGTMILVSGVLITLTGVAMFIMFLFTELMVKGAIFRWSLVAHAFFVGLVWIGLVAHIYYSVIETPEALEGMKSGYLDEDFVKHHSPGWYDELKQEGKV